MSFDIDVDANCDKCGRRIREDEGIYCGDCVVNNRNEIERLKTQNTMLRNMLGATTGLFMPERFMRPVYLCPLLDYIYGPQGTKE